LEQKVDPKHDLKKNNVLVLYLMHTQRTILYLHCYFLGANCNLLSAPYVLVVYICCRNICVQYAVICFKMRRKWLYMNAKKVLMQVLV